MTTIILVGILWIIIGLWICWKRDWYRKEDESGALAAIAVVFMPITLVIYLFKLAVIAIIEEYNND